MAISYAMVARGRVILAEFNKASNNTNSIARQILEKIQNESDGGGGDKDNNLCYSQQRYIFHVKRIDGLTVLCAADDSFGRRVPFAFLEEIHQRFVRTYGRAILTSPAYAMNDEFSRILAQEMDRFSNDPNADRLNRLKGEMTQVRTVMLENIEKVLDRGDRLNLLIEKTSALQGNTVRFRRQSRRFRNNLWWQNMKLTVLLVIISSLIVYLFFIFL